jgi:hypothetical protein
MLSWRIIGVTTGHSNATSNPASISIGRSSRRRNFHHDGARAALLCVRAGDEARTHDIG